MSDTVRVTAFVEGNADGYYTSADEMARHVRDWLDAALDDRDDISAWSIQIETEESK